MFKEQIMIMLNIEENERTFNFFTSSVSYGVATENGFKHNFCERNDLISRVLILVSKAADFSKLFDTQIV